MFLTIFQSPFFVVILYFYLVWFLYRYGNPIDKKFYSICENLFLPNKKFKELEYDIIFIQYITSCIKSGTSLVEILTNFQKEYPKNSSNDQIQKIISGIATSSPIATILQSSLQKGTAVVEPLQVIKRNRMNQVRVERKIKATTTQARLQAIIAAVIPFFILIFYFLSDSTQILSAFRSTIAWVLLFITLVLDSLGLFWMRNIFQSSYKQKNSLAWEIQAYASVFIQQWLSLVQVGDDVESAFISALSKLPKNAILTSELHNMCKNSYSAAQTQNLLLRQMYSLKQRAIQFGTPIKQELIEILEDIENQKESHWEEIAQKLPLQLLLPIFLCIFPANLCIILIPVLPMILTM